MPDPARPGRGATRARLAEILRVDHAGELAAVHIYRGQQAVFAAAGKGALGEAFASLREQEAEHLKAFVDKHLTVLAVLGVVLIVAALYGVHLLERYAH